MIAIHKVQVKCRIDTDGVNHWLKLEQKNRKALIPRTKTESRLTAEDRTKIETLRKSFAEATTQVAKDKILAEFDKLNKNYPALQK